MSLRTYQKKLRQDIEQAWESGIRNVLAVLPTGGGKTRVFSDLIHSHFMAEVVSLNRGPSCAIAHRQELVSQISMALNRDKVPHRIIGPDAVVRACVRLHMEDQQVSYYQASAQCAVAGVDTLISKLKNPEKNRELLNWCKGVTLWVQDECFPAGTLVDGVPIENLQVGDTVTAYNEETGGLEKRKVLRLFKNPSPKRMVVLYISGNKTITSTFNHPYFTKRGWVDAINILHSDRILEVCKNGKTRWRRTWAKGVTTGDGYVYNIEVEGLHTYIANGIVVHNCHHLLLENKWGKASEMFPNAKGLGVTATPERSDGKGLGREYDGVFDTMVIGPSMRELINMGYLVDYKIFAPPSDVNLSGIKISATTGDYNHDQMVAAVRGSSLVKTTKQHVYGDVVESYLKHAMGKRGITFATDVQTATDLAAQFNAAGVPALMVSANTPDIERYHAIRDLAAGRLLQLVNVDLFGEGTDVPAVEVVQFARPTESYSLFVQQFGRALRLMIDGSIASQWESFTPEQRQLHIWQSSKPRAIIIDHVGNVTRHGLPDAPRKWTLERRDKRAGKAKDPDAIPVKACIQCTAIYERIYPECPYCGYKPIPATRSSIEHVDGDLAELDDETLRRMRGEIDAVDMSLEEKRLELIGKHVPLLGQLGGVNKHKARQDAQTDLRDAMAWWGGYQSSLGRSDSEAQRRFYFRYGIDVYSAMALGTKEAIELKERIAIDNFVNIGYNTAEIKNIGTEQ